MPFGFHPLDHSAPPFDFLKRLVGFESARRLNKALGGGCWSLNGASLDISVSLMGVSSASESLPATLVSSAPTTAGDVAFPGKETVRVSIVRGYGFQTVKKGRFKKADIPDIYVQLKYGSSPTVWTSKTIKNITGVEVEAMTAHVKNGKIATYKTTVKVVSPEDLSEESALGVKQGDGIRIGDSIISIP